MFKTNKNLLIKYECYVSLLKRKKMFTFNNLLLVLQLQIVREEKMIISFFTKKREN